MLTVIMSFMRFNKARTGAFLHAATLPTSNTITKDHAQSIASKCFFMV